MIFCIVMEEEPDHCGKGFGVSFIEQDGVVGANGALHRLGMEDDLIIKMEGVDQLVDQDFEVLFASEEDDLAVLVALMIGRFQEGDTTIYLFGT